MRPPPLEAPAPPPESRPAAAGAPPPRPPNPPPKISRPIPAARNRHPPPAGPSHPAAERSQRASQTKTQPPRLRPSHTGGLKTPPLCTPAKAAVASDPNSRAETCFRRTPRPRRKPPQQQRATHCPAPPPTASQFLVRARKGFSVDHRNYSIDLGPASDARRLSRPSLKRGRDGPSGMMRKLPMAIRHAPFHPWPTSRLRTAPGRSFATRKKRAHPSTPLRPSFHFGPPTSQ